MRKLIPLSIVVLTSLYASEIELTPIDVESTVITEVSQKAKVSADLAQALSTSVPSIDMNRRSGIANDIYIRGQKRDNISVEVDGTKTCGACVNRMDPPVSHVLASQIDEVEVIEGPYDVETFGTMSGGVKIKTKPPTKEAHGEVNMGYGSFNYRKVGATASGGNDRIRLLISASSESSDQYKDGDGNTMSKQLSNYVDGTAIAGTAYQDQYKDMRAYIKRSVMAKAFVKVSEDQNLKLSVTANRSDDVLYPNSKMDALYDDSNIYNVEYNINNVTDTLENMKIQYYKSDVDHPMGTDYRKSSLDGVMVNWLTTDMQGLKFKNSFNISGHKLVIGLDFSERNWDGYYEKNGLPLMGGRKSIDNATTTNSAIFAKLLKSFGNFDVSVGARFDSTDITNDGSLNDNDYTGFNANVLATYNLDSDSKMFVGIGQASRVPDARELYFVSSMGSVIGTDTLDQTTNSEIDLGYEITSELFSLKVKGFYSKLSDYIYIQKGIATNAFSNIDAKVYGSELTGSIYATDDITLDMGLSYKVGEKDQPLAGQTDKDLADMAPLRGNVALNYEYKRDSIATLEVQSSAKWDKIDSDNGEQVIAGWSVVNMKVKHAVSKSFDFTFGVNNMLDKTYAVSNTYVDLTLVTSGTTSDVMVVNEPGRYIYTNLDFKF